MILVTGTKRSGTSLWMQILINAGFPCIAKEFIGVWEDSIKSANPQGFFESKLRFGINYSNNPNPQNGIYLHPKPSAKYAVKVFVPGLIKTDFAFVHRVVATIRPWNEYCASIKRLLDMEEDYYLKKPDVSGEWSNQVKAIIRRPNDHPALVWWRDNFDLIFDALVRLYPINIVAYDRLLESPEDVIPPVIEWCNSSLQDDLFSNSPIQGLNVEKAVQTVKQSLRTQYASTITDIALPEEVTQTFEELYDCFHHGGAQLSKGFREQLNRVHGLVEPIRKSYAQQNIQRKRAALLSCGLDEEEIKKALFFNNKDKAL